MTVNMKRIASSSVLVLVAVGCVTLPKPLYFSLDMTAPPGEGAGFAALDDRSIKVDTITVSDKLVRRDVLIHLNETEFEYYHDAKWVSRLSDLIHEKLDAEFEPPTAAQDTPTFLLAGRVLAFEQVDAEDGVYARIKLDTTLRREGESRHEPALERTYFYYEPVDTEGPMPKVVADKLSEGMEQIAADIARDANSIQPNAE